MERLDHAVANAEWSSWYNVVEVSILPRCVSNHNPLFITYSNSLELRWTKRRQFWFEAAWEKDSTSKELIKKEWRVKAPIGDSWSQARKKLDRCKKSLQIWVCKTVQKGDRLIQEGLKSQGPSNIQQMLIFVLHNSILLWSFNTT